MHATAPHRFGRLPLGAAASAAGVLAALTAALTLMMAPSALAVGCYGDYCSGQNPQSTGCSADARTVASVYVPGTQSPVELRWSPTCKTNWARVDWSWGASYPGNLKATQCATGYTQAGVVDSNSTYSWTRMIYSPVKSVRASWGPQPGTAWTWCV